MKRRVVLSHPRHSKRKSMSFATMRRLPASAGRTRPCLPATPIDTTVGNFNAMVIGITGAGHAVSHTQIDARHVDRQVKESSP